MIQDMSHSIGSIFHEDEEIWIQIGLSSTVIDRESKLKSLKVHKNVKNFSNKDKSIYSLECNRPREVIGRCFLKGYEQDILNTYMQEIEFTLDSSTISYTDGDKEYFLFGDEGSYHGEIFQYHYSVRKFNTTANEYIPEHGLYMKMLHGSLRFHSPSSGCNPIGSTRNINWRDNTIFIPNFDKTGCKAGDKIYANASVEHIFFVSHPVDEYKNIYVGEVGCAPQCEICDLYNSTKCIVCAFPSDNKSLQLGGTIESNLPKRPHFSHGSQKCLLMDNLFHEMVKVIKYQNKVYFQRIEINKCPPKKYIDGPF